MNDPQSLNERHHPILSTWQKQIVLGSLLGKSCLVKPKRGSTPYLVIRSNKKDDVNQIRWLAEELKLFSRMKSFVYHQKSYKWFSISSSVWTSLYELCYAKNKKQISWEWLDQLRDIGLAVFFLDQGRIKDNEVILKLNSFTETSYDVFSEYLTILEMKHTIVRRKKSAVYTLDEEASIKLLKIIGVCVPEYLLYRIKN